MNRKTKFASWLLAITSCACTPLIGQAYAQHSDMAAPDAYSWKAPPAHESYAPPTAMPIPIVQPEQAMEHLAPPALNFPTRNQSVVPPIVSSNRLQGESQISDMLAPVDGMPGQFAETYVPQSSASIAIYNEQPQQPATLQPAALQPAALEPSAPRAEATARVMLPEPPQMSGSGAIGSGVSNQNASYNQASGMPAHSREIQQTSAQWTANENYRVAQGSIYSPAPTMTTYGSAPAYAYSQNDDPFSGTGAGQVTDGRISGGQTLEQMPSVIVPDFNGTTQRNTFDPTMGNTLQPMDNGQFVDDMSVMPGPGFDSYDTGMIPGDPYFQAPVGEAPFVGGPPIGPGSEPGSFDQGGIAARFAASGSVAGATRYFSAEYLYWNRSDTGGFGATNAGPLGKSDGASGSRFTIGRRFDYTAGDEFSYFGTLPMTARRETVVPSPVLNAEFLAGGFFGFAELGSFFSAIRQVETRTTEIQSFEYNRVRWNWDVYKTFFGVRVINVDDDYSLFSERATTSGTLRFNTNNFMIGPHIGGEYFRDTGYRASWSFYSKLGAYLNLNELRTSLVNDGTTFIDRDVSSIELAGSLELGVIGHYQLSSRARLRGGYSLMWLKNLAGATDNFPAEIGPSTGGSVRTDEEMFFNGISIGIEIYR